MGMTCFYSILLPWWEDWVEGTQLHHRGLGEQRLRDTIPDTRIPGIALGAQKVRISAVGELGPTPESQRRDSRPESGIRR